MQTTGHQKLFNFINAALDWCVLVVSYLLSVYIRQGLMFGITNPALLLEDHYIPMALVYSTLMVGVLIFLNMYGSYRFRSFWKETVSLAMANGFGVVALGFVLYFLKMGDFARWQVAFLLAFSVVGLVGKRAVLRALLRVVRTQGHNTRAVLLVGSGPLAHRYYEELKARPYTGYNYRGYVSDEQVADMGAWRGPVAQFRQVLQKEKIEEVVVALPARQADCIGDLVAASGRYSAKISIIPSYNDFIPASPHVETVADLKMINVRRAPDKGPLWAATKRLMDLVGSGVGLVLTSPLMLGATIAVKVTSPGPVIFKQKRTGKNGKEFYMYKFRSMYQDAEERLAELQDQNEVDGPVFKMTNDPRITPAGRWLRKTSIDELPQLVNILKGDMSIVGPRPPLPKEVAQYSDWDWGRLAVRPGLTCYWQVSGRSNLSFDEWMRLDLKYIEEQGLWTDLRIIARTVGVVLRGDGAY